MNNFKEQSTDYLRNTLNTSPCKNTYTFLKTVRFQPPKSYAPNKFYTLPDQKTGRSTSMGFGKKTALQRISYQQPAKYTISSIFEKNSSKGVSFGTGRKEYYRYYQHTRKGLPSPNSYFLPQPPKKSYSIGKIRKQKKDKNQLGPGSYNITSEKIERLSKHFKSQSAKIYTESSPKKPLDYYDNKIPGPGAYITQVSDFSDSKINSSQVKIQKGFVFSKQLRMKIKKACSKIGPTTYNYFSIFGNSQVLKKQHQKFKR